MKNNKIENPYVSRCFELAENQIQPIALRKVRIHCLRGMIWVTWPDGNDRVLQKGDAISINSKGLICVQAFLPSVMATQRVKNGRTQCKNDFKNRVSTQFS